MRLAGVTLLSILAAAGGASAQGAMTPAEAAARLLSPGSQPLEAPPAPSSPPVPPPAAASATPSAADAAADARGLAYDARVRASFAAAESFQGPLDGGWTVAAAGRGDLFGLQLVDRRDRLEGAWRDLRRRGPQSVGLIEQASRTPDGATLTFLAEGGAPLTLSLRRTAAGFAGALDEAGARTPVTLRRTGP